MSLVNIINIQVLDNPTLFTNPFHFEITFECNAELKDDLEWKMIYVGSAESAEYDQVLDSIMVGPIPVGINKFVFSADAPKLEMLPQQDLLEVTVVLLCCSYMDKEFVRVGYYVNNEYLDPVLRKACEDAKENSRPPPPLQIDKLYKCILADKPKVTRYTINWDDPQAGVASNDVEMNADEQVQHINQEQVSLLS
ncbi:histone chaperone [Umbelopsis sp. PMI_123]|nr:histone chaperone [Umbelopsis sp. PMI_123]